MSGYSEIPFWRFALAVAITAIPLTFLERSNPRWAWIYALILILGFAVVSRNALGLEKASKFFSKELSK